MRLVSEDPKVVNVISSHGRTALHAACDYGSVGLVTCLLDHGANINKGTTGVGDEPPHTTPLLLACSRGHTRVVDLLLKRGADPTLADGHGVAPLMLASLEGSVECVTQLLEHDAARTTINAHNVYGENALHAACWKGHSKVVKMLLGAGADAALITKAGGTPMDLARFNSRHKCVKLLQVR